MFKVHINRSPYDDALDFYFVEEVGKGELAVAKPMDLVWEIIKPGHRAEPSLKIWGPLCEGFLTAMAEALDKNGIKIEKDAKIQGTLEATRYHLEDLRTLLKLTKKKEAT